ncbi:FG-GAP-like repeat-containing protein [Limibacter armeniacum]|uniref:FG-GAP-like repeat-containing protein n=1 Tax=Limibacter armeniacum TaxID=466084 RepID=UPI002FE5FF04
MKRIFFIYLLAQLIVGFAFAQPPAISSFSPESGPIGTQVTIQGTDFDETPENNIVFFGGVKATVSAATSTALTVEVPVGASYDYLYVNTTGLIAQSSRPFTVTFDSDGSIGSSPSTFADVVDFETHGIPLGFDLGDLDGDGKLDMAAGATGQAYSIYLNSSTGPGDINFSKTVFSASAKVNDLRIADLDGDGRLDFAAVTEDGLGAEYLEIWRNTITTPGTVSFVQDANMLLDGYTYDLNIADFNGDGKMDVVTVDWDNNVVSIYENSSSTGSISFEDDVDFDVTITGSDPDSHDVALAIGDLNGDGLTDIVTTDFPDGGPSITASILENTSSGGSLSFATKVDIEVVNIVKLGDLNGDGLAEMIIPNFSNFTIYPNESTGSIAFASPEVINVSNGWFGLALEDFNGDGKADLLVSEAIFDAMRVLENTSTGSGISFSSGVDFDLSPAYTPYANYTTGDMDGDGEPDMVVPSNYYIDPSSKPKTIGILRNKNSQTDITAFSFGEQFGSATIDEDAHTIEIAVGVPSLAALTPTFELPYGATATVSGMVQTSGTTANDFTSPVIYTITAEDGSTTQDWTVTVSSAIPTITSFAPASAEVGSQITITGSNFSTNPTSNIVYFGGVKATVLSATSTELTVEVPAGASSEYLFVTVGGLIAQSSTRFIVSFDSDGTIGLTPDTFADAVTFSAGDQPYGFDLGDLDGDGLNDIVTGNYGGDFSVFVNTSTGIGNINFAAKADFSLSAYANDIKLADFDGDGKLDVAAVTEDDAYVSYLEVKRNTTSTPGSVNFANEANITLDGYNWVLDATDFNGDGKLDILVLDSDNGVVSVYENASSVGAISFKDNVDFTIGSDPYDVTFGDINADGLLDIITLDGSDGNVSVLENTSSAGSISFATKVDFALNLSTSISSDWIEVGDLNGDGLPEIVVKNNETISIFKNETTTSIAFATPNEIAATLNFGPIALDDYNGDGKLDLLFGSLASQVGVFKNTSSGSTISFADEVLYGTLASYLPMTFISGDLDGDGETDLAGTIRSNSTADYKVAVLRNNGSKSEIKAFSFADELAPAIIDAAARTIEINVDGVPDLTSLTASFELSFGATATVASTTQTSGVTANDFTNPVIYTITAEDGSSTQDWTVSVALGCSDDIVNLTEVACESYDFDGEIIRTSGIYTRVYTNLTGCDSTVTVDLTIHPIVFYDNVYAVGNYDFDGATLTASGQYEYGPFTSTVTGCDSTFVLNLTIEPDTYDTKDYLQFQASATAFPIMIETAASHIADVDGDGEEDVFFIGKSTAGQIASLFIHDGSGNYIEKTDHAIPATRVGNRSSLFFDADGDDALDYLVFGQQGGINITQLYINDGAGNFTEKTDHGLPIFTDVVYNTYLDSADVDGDDDLDLVLSNYNPSDGYESQAQIYLNNGDGSFVLSTANDFPIVKESLADFADFDGDGHVDLLISGYELDNKIWINDGTGVFTQKLDQSLAKLSSNGTLIFDMDGDGDMDIYDSNARGYSGYYTPIFFNNGDGSFTYDLSSEIPKMDGYTGGEAGTLSKAVDFDNDGDLDMILEGRYHYAGGPSIADYLDVWINNGYGHFKPLLSHTLTKTFPEDGYEFGKIYGYGSYQFSQTLSVHDFDGDGRMDILISGDDYFDTYEKVTRILSNKVLSSDLVIEATGSYDFDGKTLTESGQYQGIYTDEYGSSYPVNLDLTIIPYVEASEYADVKFELLQPTSSPKVGLDILKGNQGQHHIYDMDGDGDQDVLYFAISPSEGYQVIAYLNDGKNNYRKVEQEHNFVFDSSTQFPVVLNADLNGDGVEDLLIGGEPIYAASPKDLGTKVYFGDSQGQLHYQSDIVLPSCNNGGVRIADFNDDTYPDIFIVKFSNAYLYLNDGAGNFTSQTITGMNNGSFLNKVAVSEPYNGGVDIIVSDYNAGHTDVIYRCEGGVFSEVSRGFRTVSGYYHTFEFADANADNYPDIFILDDTETLLYLNDQSGNYVLDTSNDFDGLQTNYEFSLHFKDLNNDGAAEVLFSDYFNELAVFWNDGTGQYAAHQTLELNDDVGRIAIGDLNGDGYADILNSGVSNRISSSVEWVTRAYINDQSNGFEAAQFNVTTEFREGDIVFLDADKDGDQDMLVSGAYYGDQKMTEYYKNDGEGNFTEVTTHPFAGLQYASIAVADFNGDEVEDVVLSGLNASDELQTTLYWNDGTGNFTEDTGNSFSGISGKVVAFDANGDQVSDLLVVGKNASGSPIAELYLNDGSGNLSLHTAGIEGLIDVSVTTGDVNGDKAMDIFLCGTNGTGTDITVLYLNDGTGNFTAATGSTFEPISKGKMLLLDIDNDKDLDLYLSGSGKFLIYENDGAGAFTQKHGYDGPFLSTAVAGDIDLDGDIDIIESGKWESETGYPRTFVYFNNGTGNFTKSNMGALHSIYDGAIALADIDHDMDMDIMLSGAVKDPVTNSSRLYRNATCGTITTFEQAVSSCNAYDFYGTILTASGTYTHSITTEEGCERTVTLEFDYLKDESTEVVEACESYEWNGVTYTESGTYQELFINSVGCDSLATLTLTILELTSSEETVEACESYDWNGVTYTASGIYEVVFTNSVGCDSTATLTLTILESTSSEETVEACESYDWNGVTYTASGVYEELFTNSVGCDSVATLTLTILEPTSSEETVEACESYDWNGVTYTTSGVYEELFTNSVGCDSVATLTLTILESTSSEETVEACESYDWNGVTYTTSGVYEELFTNSVGCDSVATLTLTILESTSSEETVEACESYDWNGVTYTESGVYEEVFTNSVGCDSTVTLYLSIQELPVVNVQSDGVSLFIEAQEGMSYQWYDCDTGEALSGETNTQLTPSKTGDYYLEVSNGICSRVSDCVLFVSPLGLETLAGLEVRVFPTVTTETFTLDLNQQLDDIKVRVISLDGQVIKEVDHKSFKEGAFKLSGPSGMYLIHVSTGGKLIGTYRVIKM